VADASKTLEAGCNVSVSNDTARDELDYLFSQCNLIDSI